MFSRIGSAAYKEDLTNIRTLCEHLHNPHQGFKSIHVAGTNGKGSVSHMLAAIFQTAGYKTGLHTSPHLHDFRERIKINGKMVSKEFVTAFVERIKPLIEEIEPSFFEISVAMAFQAFAEQKVDIAIIEVGLGGRLDSTNIIAPELSIITNIGWDHMNLLGDSLEKIAAEKAGIIKENIPVVVGETLPETSPVFQQTAGEKKAQVYRAEDYLQVKEKELRPASLSVSFQKRDDSVIEVKTDLAGLYQVQNLRTVLTAADILKKQGWNLTDEIILDALKKVKAITGLKGRWDVIHHSPAIVLDVAHNQDGLQRMLEHVHQLSFGQLHLVFGTVRDKDVSTILKLLPIEAHYYFTQANIPRALPANELKDKAETVGLKGKIYSDVNAALNEAKSHAGKEDLILVCGSIFLVAEVDKSQYFNSPNRSKA